MTTAETLDDLKRRILAGYPVLLLKTYEEHRWEEEVANLAFEMDRGVVSWSLSGGAQPPLAELTPDESGALTFLKQVDQEYPADHLFILKDFHLLFDNHVVVRKVRDILDSLQKQNKTLLIVSPLDEVPLELNKDVSVLELPLPGPSEIREVLQQVLESGNCPQPDQKQEDHLIKAVLGLTLAESRNAFKQVLSSREVIDDESYVELVKEKRRMVQGSNLLEFFDLDESIDDVGGLDGLKEWIHQRAEAFTTDASEQGVSNPKGVLLAGVQGCGKSLSAKAIARLLGFPLVRMDLGTLLEGQRGSSEQNLRDVLQLMETISPAVLWMEEIDKALAGFSDEASSDATMARIVGRFLTWLQEHTDPVFVVATANNVSNLPPELLRRGRFDELFFVDLPNYYERKSIFEIHLKRRGWKTEKFDIEKLSNDTEGFSGAEIETVVNSAIIESFAQKRMPTMNDLDEARERTIPLSVTMEDEIFHLREWARTRCRPATLDNRVIQIMEEEERRGEAPLPEELETPKWIQLAEHGQIPAAIIEHIRLHDNVTWDQLLHDIGAYTDTTGQFGLVLRSDPKIVVWTRMSRSMADTLIEYVAGRRLYLHPVESKLYEGIEHPNLPAIGKLPEQRIDQPVFFPTKFRLLPPDGGSGRLAHLARIKMGRS